MSASTCPATREHACISSRSSSCRHRAFHADHSSSATCRRIRYECELRTRIDRRCAPRGAAGIRRTCCRMSILRERACNALSSPQLYKRDASMYERGPSMPPCEHWAVPLCRASSLCSKSSHNYIGHNYIDHNYIGRNHKGQIGHIYICHNCIGHNHVGHTYLGHSYLLAAEARARARSLGA